MGDIKIKGYVPLHELGAQHQAHIAPGISLLILSLVTFVALCLCALPQR